MDMDSQNDSLIDLWRNIKDNFNFGNFYRALLP